MRIGVLTGLTAEARLLRAFLQDRPSGGIVGRTGACSSRASSEAERLVASGAIAIVSFGLAAGIDPRLRAGDLVLADRVVLPDGRSLATERDWLVSAYARAEGPRANLFIGPVAGIDRLLATVDEKRRLAGTGVLAGDMESAAAALAAERAGLPFLVVRAISDDAGRSLPSVAQVPLRPCGGVRFDAVAQALCARPGEWPAVARLALDTRAALDALRGVVRSGALLPPLRLRRRLDGLPNDAVEDEFGGALALERDFGRHRPLGAKAA
jgi:adenosylhomocysteine nucleosidase